MKIYILTLLAWSIAQMSFGQTCYRDLSLNYNSNVMEVVGSFLVGKEKDSYGSTNRILIIDRDNLGTSNPVKICGIPQTSPLYENKCITVADYDQKFVMLQVTEPVELGGNPCYSRDFVYIDIVDTKFSWKVLPNCGGFELTNNSEPFTAVTPTGEIPHGQLNGVDATKSWDYFPKSIYGSGILGNVVLPVTYIKSPAELATYEFIVTNTITKVVTTYSSIIGQKLNLPNNDYKVELRIKGIANKLNQISQLYKTEATKTITRKACVRYNFYNTIYSKSGIYTHTKLNAGACDSVITLNLTILAPTASTVNVNKCQATHKLNGITYSNSGTFTQTQTNKAGCDSTITLNLKLNKPTSSIINQSTCSNYVLNGQTYNTSGTFTQTLKNKAGCDSTITLNLKINKATSSTVNQISCNPSFTLNGKTYDTGGNYQQIIPNKAGCDSVITLNLTFVKINTEVKVTVENLTAVETNAAYNWFDCAAPTVKLQNSDAQVYKPIASGNYGVVINKSGCKATSGCVTFKFPLSTDELDARQQITLTPNPTSGIFTLAFGQIKSEATVYLISALGQTVSTIHVENTPSINVELQSFPAGLYHIYLYEKDKKVQSFSIVKE